MKISLKKIKIILLMFGFVTLLCKTTETNYSLYKMKPYTSKSGLFTINFPKDLKIGIRAEEENRSLKIYDDLGNFYRIDYLQLPREEIQKIENDNLSEIDVLKYNSEVQFFQNTLQISNPGSNIVSKKEFENHLGLNYFLLLYIPGGSTLTKNGVRDDIHRAITTFRVNDILFMANTQENINIFGNPKEKSISQIEKEVEDKTKVFLSTLEVIK